MVYYYTSCFTARLNEGFATFVGWLAVDEFYPEWDVCKVASLTRNLLPRDAIRK